MNLIHDFFIFQCYNEYGDIIKTTMGKAREINKINCALTMVLSLVSTYRDMQNANDSLYVSKSSQSFTDLKVTCDDLGKFGQKYLISISYDRNWQNDSPCHSGWTLSEIVKRLSCCIVRAFYLLCKTLKPQKIHPHLRHVCCFWKFSTNSPTNCWSKTKKWCKFADTVTSLDGPREW